MGNYRRTRKDNNKDDEEKKTYYNNNNNNLSSLPLHVGLEIIAKLSPELLLELSYSCKRMNKMITGNNFIAKSFSCSKPSLLIQIPSARTRKFRSKLLELDDELGLGFKAKKFNIPRMYRARSNCNGLLLISDERRLAVVNFLTKCSVYLPECPSSCPHRHCSLSLVFDPSQKVYKVVHIYADGLGFEIFTLGCPEKQWRVVPGPFVDDPSLRPFDEHFRWGDPLATDGRLTLHWDVDSHQYLISMDVCEETCWETFMPPFYVKGQDAVLEMGGKLAVMHRNSERRFDLWVLTEPRGQDWQPRCSIASERMSYLPHQDVNRVPSFENLAPIFALRDGDVIVFQHKSTSCWYFYETKLGKLKKVGDVTPMDKDAKLMEYRSSLVYWEDEKELFHRETI